MSTAQEGRPGRDSVEVVVVGGGAAGLSAAKILARSCRSVLVVDAGAPRNAPAEGVHNYLYAEGTSPQRLRETGRAEALAYDVEVVDGTATAATVLPQPEPGGPRFTVGVRTVDGATRTVQARRLVLATGLVDVLPDVAGLRERWGRDVLHCPFCHGWEVRDQAIGVIGTNPMALHQVMLFRRLTEDVVYFQHTAPDPTEEQREQLAALGVEHVAGEVAAVQTAGTRCPGCRWSTAGSWPARPPRSRLGWRHARTCWPTWAWPGPSCSSAASSRATAWPPTRRGSLRVRACGRRATSPRRWRR